jgi:hypothetical protein
MGTFESDLRSECLVLDSSGLCLSCIVRRVESLVDSLDSGIETLHIVQNLTQGGINLIDSALEVQWDAGDEIYTLLKEVNQYHFCPEVRVKVCPNISDTSTCNFEGLDIFDEKLIEQIGAGLNIVRSVLRWQIEKSKDDLEEFLVFTNRIENTAQSYYWAFQIARFFGLLLAALCFLFVLGVAFRLPKVATCLRHRIVVPMFVFLVILSFVFSLVFIVGSTTLADMCVDSPDPRMLVLVEKLEPHFSPITYDFVLFYINRKLTAPFIWRGWRF